MTRLLIVFALLLLAACNKTSSVDIEEAAQQVGDTMASIDESGGSTSGSFALLEAARKTFARVEPQGIIEQWQNAALPEAQAAACSATTFSSCSSKQRVRTLGGCTIGGATFEGTITLDFSRALCVLTTANDTVTRNPAFTVTGRRGATLTVSKTGTEGQKITYNTASSFSFSNDGIRRVFTLSDGTTAFDFTTTTTSAITVTGASRTSRTLSGGSLRVANNSTGTTCDLTPSGVTWVSTCNCPTSGSWSGTCSDGKSISLTLDGCGSATFTLGSDSQTMSFDRCYGS